LSQSGHRVGAWKPVCSGVVKREGRRIWEDIQALADAIEGTDPAASTRHKSDLTDRICDQRFELPMAPNIAAHHENRVVSDDILLSGPQAWRDHAELVVIEGAGGLLSPASDTLLCADLVAHLQTRILLVAANRLGTIHQTLATIESAQARGLNIVGVVLNEVVTGVSEALRAANESEFRRLIPDLRLIATSHDSPETLQSAVSEIETWFTEM
jgi:dethiobiotin synthetase